MKSFSQMLPSFKSRLSAEPIAQATGLAAKPGKDRCFSIASASRWTMHVSGMLAMILLLAWTTPARAKSQWELLKSLKLKHRPTDLHMSADRRHLYILTDRGQIMIYGADGQLKDAIEVGRKVDQIKAGPGENTLFLLSRKEKTVKMIRISTIEEIDITNAPYKGNEDAEVAVIVFSDFQ